MTRGWGGFDLPLGDLGEGRREEEREGKKNRWLIHGDDSVDSRAYHPAGIAACLVKPLKGLHWKAIRDFGCC